MNKIIISSVLFAALLSSACGNEASKTAESRSTNSSNSNVSFGIYDISRSSSVGVAQGDNSDSTNKPAVLRTTSSTLGGGGGGGGDGRNENQTISPDQISLNQAATSQNNAVTTERKIVRNGELHVECEQPDEAQKRIALIAQNNGGFVVESQQSTSDVKINTRDIVQMTVRVPADKFAETVDQIKAASGRIIQETIRGEDVTEEFIDIDARLKAKKALEQQFIEIMKRANTVDDALTVHRQLADVRSEIEKIEGRKRFLENQASLSTIKVRLQTSAVFSANSSGFLYRLSESFGNGFEIASNFVLGLVTFVVGALPLFLFVGLPGYLIARAVMRRRNRPLSVAEIAKEELDTK